MNDPPKTTLGAWARGNDGIFGNDFTAEGLKPIFDAGMANGLNLWDAACAYGMGASGKVLAGFIKDLPRESDHFICKTLATYADETVLNEKDKIDYHTFKPVLFEFPTYENFATGDKVGDCGRMNAE